jgi:glycosyltransferase involved in cell wall biosynthesis
LHKNSKNRIDDKIDLWTKYADHVISGCEWVDYMYHWDTLTLAHFSIELLDNTNTKYYTEGAFKVFHAPNHVQIKGTNHLKKAIKSLQKDGYNIELVMLRGVSNDKIIKTIQEVDLVADQFVVGWYAMFALEAMSLGKPVLCYLRDDLIDLYIKAELIEKDEIPIINTSVLNIKEQLIWCYENRGKLNNIGKNSRQYVQNHHSIEYIGKIFDNINSTLNIK